MMSYIDVAHKHFNIIKPIFKNKVHFNWIVVQIVIKVRIIGHPKWLYLGPELATEVTVRYM